MANTIETSFRQRAGRALGDLVMAELFLVQATIESASALSESIDELREHLSREDASHGGEELTDVIRRSGEKVVEPYTTRLRYLREIVREDMAA